MAISKKQYSIAEARDHLARLVHEAEQGGPVELTRRGKPVAVILSMAEYTATSQPDFWLALEQFRAGHDLAELAFDPDEFLAGTRDESPGRSSPW